MANVVVVGTQWGDEGKGKLVDILAGASDLVVRYQGGANAGHTLLVGGQKLVLHLIPSGVMNPGKRVAIGPAVVVDPDVLILEIESLKERGLLAEANSLLVDHRAHMVMPYHKMLDGAREKTRTQRIGTTLRGIGPCLEDKSSRFGIRLCDLKNPRVFAERLTARLPEVNAVLRHYGEEPARLEEILAQSRVWAEKLAPFLGDAGEAVRKEMDRGRNVLFEGAQGSLLDIDHGTYPFVTSSNTVAGAACSLMGIGPGRINAVVGVAKAYATRVGEGPFPTELTDERGEQLRKLGDEFGSTTGRPRRCGWLDLAALRYAVALNGCTSLCLTKLDVLSGIDTIKVAVGYHLDGVEIDTFPPDAESVSRLEPVYEELEGWTEDLREVREKDALPATAKRYLAKLENALGLPVDIISVGAGRTDTIMIQNPFRRPRD